VPATKQAILVQADSQLEFITHVLQPSLYTLLAQVFGSNVPVPVALTEENHTKAKHTKINQNKIFFILQLILYI
jgi:hypothetical protein